MGRIMLAAIVLALFQGEAWGGPREGHAAIYSLHTDNFGNVFAAPQRPSFRIETQAEAIDYSVSDYAGRTVAEGTFKPENGAATLRPEVNALGYFHVRLTLRMKDSPPIEKQFDFGVLRSFAGIDMSASPFGVMTHFAQNWNTELIPLLAKYGVAAVRDEVYWGQVETKRGEFDFTRQDAYMGKLKEAGIRPLIVLSFANKLYDGGMTPYSPEGCDGYARYAAEVLRHYGSQIRWLEVWNEYNGSFCAGRATEDRPRYYTAMAKTSYAKIKAVRPDVTVLGCAPVLIPLPYFEGIFKRGGLDAMDAVVIHPYRGRPEGVEREIDDLNELMKRYNHGETKPVWCTEYGYGLHNAGSLANVAKNLVRQSVLLRSRNVQRMFWYLFSDYASFQSMGLVQLPGSPNGRHAPNPAGPAFANMAWLLHDARYEAREAVAPFTKCHVHKFVKPGGGEIRVCWATYPATIVVEASGRLVRCDLMGNETPLAVEGGRIEIPLDDTPFYLLGPVKGVSERPAEEMIIADSGEEYSATQGENHWSYGYFDGTGPRPYGGADFKPMRQVETVWGVNWSAEAGRIPFLALSREGGHPALLKGKPVWAVRRWESPLDGTVRLDGRIAVGDSRSHGVEYVLLVDGKPADKIEVAASADKKPTAIRGQIEVHRGSQVDFCVNPGPDNDLGFDAFAFEVRLFVRRGK